MKRYFNILLSVLIVSSTVIMTTACSSDAKDGGSVNAGNKTTIEFLNQKRESIDVLTKIVDQYNKSQDKVIVKLNSPAEATTVISSRAASGDLPEVFTDWPMQANYGQYVDSGLLEDLTNEPYMDTVNETALEISTRPDGKIYTAPLALNTYGIFYSVEDFEELNITIPTTYDELILVCEKLQAAGKTPFMFPDKDSWTVEQEFMFNTGVWDKNFLDTYRGCKEGYITLIEDDGIQQTASRMLDLRNRFGQKDSLGTSYDDAISNFATGKSSMFMQGIWALDPIKQANPEFEFNVFAVPGNTADETRVEIGVDLAFDVSKDSKNKEAALEFVRYMMTPETAKLYSETIQVPTAIEGGNAELTAIAPLVKYVEEGKSFPQLMGLHTTDIATNEPAVCQQLIVSQDIDEFKTSMNDLWANTEK
ncbi:ABC transporter substrate-binding protein [Massiliimalia timonensis]|uniref:ABC transporter substrate-binding protein n=1 Tax=Massiliimalia timonensis TaxID=1987501 RepID=UPI000B8AAD41|nr:extracellular solute-binding protein [Massiliimalia timonensis]